MSFDYYLVNAEEINWIGVDFNDLPKCSICVSNKSQNIQRASWQIKSTPFSAEIQYLCAEHYWKKLENVVLRIGDHKK